MDVKNNKSPNKEAEKILADYKEKSDSLIRQMLQIVVNIHKKIDQSEYKKWARQIK